MRRCTTFNVPWRRVVLKRLITRRLAPHQRVPYSCSRNGRAGGPQQFDLTRSGHSTCYPRHPPSPPARTRPLHSLAHTQYGITTGIRLYKPRRRRREGNRCDTQPGSVTRSRMTAARSHLGNCTSRAAEDDRRHTHTHTHTHLQRQRETERH